MSAKARNTRYHILFNEDWRINGKYHLLTDCAVRVFVILSAYADHDGWIRRSNGTGNSYSELQDMTRLPYKRLRLALQELIKEKIVVKNMDGALLIKRFVEDNYHRPKDTRGIRERTALEITSQRSESDND